MTNNKTAVIVAPSTPSLPNDNPPPTDGSSLGSVMGVEFAFCFAKLLYGAVQPAPSTAYQAVGMIGSTPITSSSK